MGLGRARAVALVGVEGHPVEVEAHVSQGLPAFTLVGLPDTSLSESRDRVRAAVLNSALPWPEGRITVNLSPASLPKRGSSFDLAIACAVLAATGAIPPDALRPLVLLGELGLDGRLRPVRGVLPAVIAATSVEGLDRVIVPAANAAEAALVPGADVVGLVTLRALAARLRGEQLADEDALADEIAVDAGVGVASAREPSAGSSPEDLADVRGQQTARWALELAAAGGHHMFLLGPPGAGKTMLAERLPGLLPDLDDLRALEVTAVHSVAGTLRPGAPLVRRPPFQAPHHTSTKPAVVGGGSGMPRPGAASVAHGGILFLDEAPEFSSGVLDALRQPLESGEVVLMRAGGTARYPARFQLVAAANPCPCGFSHRPDAQCTCAPSARRRYLGRLSGPLLDRIDLRLWVDPPSRADLLRDASGAEPTAVVAARVRAARDRSAHRFRAQGWACNAEPPGAALRAGWPPSEDAVAALERGLHTGEISMRGADRVLRVAWTISDLAGIQRPGAAEIRIALGLRRSMARVA